MDIVSYILSKSYVDKTLVGMGALKGSPAMISSIVDNPDGTHDITFSWKDNSDVTHTSILTVANGETPTIASTEIEGGHTLTFATTNPSQTVSFNVMDGEEGQRGVSVIRADVDNNNYLKLELSDGNIINAGQIKTVSMVDNTLSLESANPVENRVITSALNNKVNKVSGKQLSTEDFTTAEKNKLANIENGAQVNTLENLIINGEEATIVDKKIALNIITSAVSNLQNYYLKSETYTKTEVDDIANAIKNSRFEVVSTLPTTNIKTNVIYLIPSADPKTANVKDEYINLDGTTSGWELIGSTAIDLSDYITTSELNAELASYVTSSSLTTTLANYVTSSNLNTTLTNYVTSSNLATTLADYATLSDVTTQLANKQDVIQLATMPTASVDYLDKIVQYIGATNVTYTNGYFYKCISDGGNPATYAWERIDIQPSEGGVDLSWVTPQDYGAVGDGVTDDTVAIQTAMNSGKTVYFPKGIYIVSSTISIPSETTIIGDYGNAVIKVDESISSDMSVITIGFDNSKHDISIEGMIIRGSEVYGDDSHGISLVDVRGSTNITFSDCIFQNNMYSAIRLINGSSNIKVFSCRFEATDCCIASFGDDSAVSDITIRNCHFTGVSSYNNFHNTASECVGTFTSPSAGVSRRWVIEDCIFEQKKTNAISFNVHNATSSSGVLIEDCVVRNCTFRATLGGVLLYHTKNVTIDGLAFDDTDIAYPNEMYIQALVGVQYGENVTIRNVTSASTKVRQPFRFQHASNCLVENIDTYVDIKESSPLHYMYVNDVDKSVFRNFTIRPIDDNNRAVIQLKAITNSYVEILSNAQLGSEVLYYFETIANVNNNTFVGDTDGGFLIQGATNTSTASTNQWRKIGKKYYNKGDLSLNQYQIAYAYSVHFDNQSAFDTALAKANIPLLENGADMIIRVISSTYSNGKSFSFNTTGNLIPIDEPFVISNAYTVVCHFVQKRAKWVEVERTLEYYEGANIEINGTQPAQFEVTTSGWTADTTSQSGTTLYKKSITLTQVNTEMPMISIGATGTLPTVAQQAAFNLIQYVTLDNTVPCLYLYASAIPTDAFYIKAEGVS